MSQPQQYDILAEPLTLDGATVVHEFDKQIRIPVPVDLETCAAHPDLFARYYSLWRKAEAWVARLKREVATKRDLAVARITNQSEATNAMAAGMAAKLGTGKPMKVAKLSKWQVDLTSKHSPEVVEKLKELAYAEATTARLEGWVEALRERGKKISDMVRLQTSK